MKHVRTQGHLALCALVAAGLLGLTACSGSSSEPTTTTTTTTTAEVTTSQPAEVNETTTATTTPKAPAAAPATTEPKAAAMPNVVCMNLQEAQNTIQEAGVFYSRSKDATGQGRRQVVDSNWIVVAQTPSAGAPVTEGEAVLSAVKIGEPSPC